MSVTKRTRSGRVSWRVQWRDPDGRQHEKTFPTERDAKRYDHQIQHELAQGSYVDLRDSTTLGAYAAYYLSTKSLTGSSQRVYAGYLRRINAGSDAAGSGARALGSRPLGKIQPSEITGWVSRQQDDGLAPKTVVLMVSFLRSVYAAAVQDRKCRRSPVPKDLHLGSSPGNDADIIVPTVEQVDGLADAMERLEPRCRALIVVQSGLGLRIGELLVLRAQDVDRARHEVRICGRLLPESRERAEGTKGSRGRRLKTRTVPLVGEVARELAEHQLRYPPRSTDGALFTDPAGELWSYSAYEWRFAKARESAGLNPAITSHKLRYHFCSVAMAKGVPLKDVATFLGHSDTRLVERIYGHVMSDAGARFIERMGTTWGQGAAV